MPVTQTHVDPMAITAGLIQPRFKFLGDVFGDADSRRFSTGRPVALATFCNKFWRRRSSAAHVEEERLDILQTIRPPHSHEQDRYGFLYLGHGWMVAGLPLAEFMNHVDRSLNMLDGGRRQDAVPEIEDVSVS